MVELAYLIGKGENIGAVRAVAATRGMKLQCTGASRQTTAMLHRTLGQAQVLRLYARRTCRGHEICLSGTFVQTLPLPLQHLMRLMQHGPTLAAMAIRPQWHCRELSTGASVAVRHRAAAAGIPASELLQPLTYGSLGHQQQQQQEQQAAGATIGSDPWDPIMDGWSYWEHGCQ